MNIGMQYRQGWFTYAYCFNKEVRQFREMAHSHPHGAGTRLFFRFPIPSPQTEMLIGSAQVMFRKKILKSVLIIITQENELLNSF